MSNPLDIYKFCPNCSAKLELKTMDGDRVRACLSCGFIFWNNPKPVTSVLLHKNNKILMLKRAKEPLKDYWVMPGGFIKYDESADEAVRREAKEETGLDVGVGRVIGTYRIDNDPRGMHIDIIFEGNARGEVELSDENSEWEYFHHSSLPEKIAYKHREAIQDWASSRF